MPSSPQSDRDTSDPRVRRQETVAEFGQDALEADDLDQLLRRAATAASDALDAEYVAVFELLPDAETLRLGAGAGWRDGLVGTERLPTDRETLLGYTLRSAAPVSVDEFLSRDAGMASPAALFTDHDVTSGISVVVGSTEHPWGVLGAYSSEQREFTGADRAFLRHVADILDSAIETVAPRRQPPDGTDDLTDRVADAGQDRIVRALETTGEGISLLDENGEFVYVNEAYAALYGYEPTEMVGEHWEMLYPDGEQAQIYDEVFPQLAETGTWTGETTGLRKDGTTFIEDHRLAATAGDEMVCTVRDATTEHEQQRRLEDQEAALRETYEVISDQDLSFEEKVDALLRIGRDVIGTTSATLSRVEGEDYHFEVVQTPDGSVQGGDVVPLSATNCERAITTEETLVLEDVAVDAPDLADRAGNADWGISCYLGAPVYAGDDVYGTLCFYDETAREEPFTDWQVTLVDLLSRWVSFELERETRKRELEQYRAYTNTVLDAIDDVFYVLDESGELRRWNETLTDVAGYSDGDVASMSALEFFADGDKETIATAIAEGFETGQVRVEAPVCTATGESIPYEFVACTLEDPDGETVLAGIGRDITVRRKHERALEESNERLEQFAYAASHDLQEPLRMVTSYLKLVEDRYADQLDENGREFVEFAVDGAERMREMIEGLLEYSRVETRGDPFEPVDLNEIFEDVLADLRLQIEESDAEISADRLPRVEGDASQLRQLFQNLLSNALTYTDGEPEIDVSATRRGQTWEISVRDDGIGIDPENRDRVFTVFDRLHSHDEYEGAGIGLALCKRIVERHGVRPDSARPGSTDGRGESVGVPLSGRSGAREVERSESAGGEIWVDSEPGEGSTFTFTLPAATDVATDSS